MGLGRVPSLLTYSNLHQDQPTSGQFTFWSTLGARTSHGQLWIHKTHHGPDSRKPPPSPIQYSLRLPAAPTFEWLFVPRLLRWNLETIPVWTPGTLEAHNSQLKPPIEMRFEANCSSPQELFNGVSQSTCTHRDRVDSRLLVVGSQTGSLNPDPSFDHNLCCRCPNGSCEAILNIYTSRPFQRHKNISMRGVLTPAIEL